MGREQRVLQFKEVYNRWEKDYQNTVAETFTGTVFKIPGSYVFNALVNEGLGFPVVLGRDEEGNPIVCDLEKETATMLVGGAGSGKSWALRTLLLSLITTKSKDELDIRLVNTRQERSLEELSALPHVTEYSGSCPEEYTRDMIQRVVAELEKRKDELNNNTLGAETIREYREKLHEAGKDEEASKFPLVVVVLSEFLFTLKRLEDNLVKEEFVAFTKNIERLVQTGRAYGVHVIIETQSTDARIFPGQLVYDTSLRLGFNDTGEDVHRELDSPGDFVVKYTQGKGAIKRGASIAPGASREDILKVFKTCVKTARLLEE